MELARWRSQFEVIAINRRIAGLAVCLEPLPRAESDERVASVVNCRAQRLFVRVAGIKLEELRLRDP